MRYDRFNRKISKLNDELKRSKTEFEQLRKENEELKSVLVGMMHEIRRFSGEISNYSEQVSKLTTGGSNKIRELSDTIFYTSEMLASRLAFTDIELNPGTIPHQHKFRTVIYKKFDKARYILSKRASSKKIKINFIGNSLSEFDAMEAFQLVPFVILDNAIKYSPVDQEINVNFIEMNRELQVTVSSFGPKVDNDELPTIFQKGIRSRNGTLATSAGDGIGLYLAKTLCDLTAIKITADSNQQVQFNLNGIGYSTFEIVLTKIL